MTQVILDCDPGHDDAIAILLALASPEVELLGVTTVAGNQTLEKTTANAIRVLDHVGRDNVPVAAGARRPLVRELQVAPEVHGMTGLDGSNLPPPGREPEPEHAVDWIAKTLAAAATPVTVVPTGPLTNVALFLARYPELEAKVERIVLMGGAIGLGNVTPAAEFNIWADPEAASRVFSSRPNVTMLGLDVTHKALMTQGHADQLAQAGRAGRLVADLYEFSVQFHRRHYGWNGTPVHDACAVAQVIDPTLFETKHCGVTVDTAPEPSRGRTYVDLWGGTGGQPGSYVAVDVEVARFFELLLRRIGGLGS